MGKKKGKVIFSQKTDANITNNSMSISYMPDDGMRTRIDIEGIHEKATCSYYKREVKQNRNCVMNKDMSGMGDRVRELSVKTKDINKE